MTLKHITGKRIALLAVIILLGISGVQVLAQNKKKGTTPKGGPVKDSTTADRLALYDSTRYHYFLFPQFYSYWPIDNNDTILKYECFDASGNSINMDTLYNINDVQHISFVKIHTDYTQTYIDAEGKPKPQPVSKTLYKYDRTGPDTWTGLDLIYNYTSQLQEYKNDIIRTDTTTIIDPITGTRQITVRKYYKVVEIGKPDSAISPNEPAQAEQTSTEQKPIATTTYIYNVPEFYYYLPKKYNDTTIAFVCYDYRDSAMRVVTDYDSVRYFSLFKSYTDSTHKYKDDDGVKKFLPVSTIIKRYDRLSKDRWMTIEYPSNKYQELTEYKNVIVSSDTVTMIDPINDKTIQKVFNRYKVVK